MSDPPRASLLERLRERKLVRVLLLYAALAWGLAQVAEFFVDNYDLSRRILDATLFALAVGFPAAGVLAWFHGEKGHQRVTRTEGLLLGVLGLVAVAGLFRIGTAESPGERNLDSLVDLGSHSVAVLPFGVSHPDLEWLRLGASELLTTGLASHSEIRVVSGRRLYDLLRQEGYEEAATLPPGLGTELTRRAGARYMIDGSVLGDPGDVVLRADLVDVESGDVAISSRARGGDVFELIDRVGVDLANQIAGRTIGAAELTSVGRVTRSPEAYREYLLGLLAERRFHDAEAIGHFRTAVSRDSTFALANMRLALLSLRAGDVSGGLEALRSARAHLESAPRRDSLFIEALRENVGGGDTERARGILEGLLEEYPDDKEVRAMLVQMVPGTSDERGRLLEETLRLDPLDATAYNSLAYFRAYRGEFEAADSLIARYVELEPREPNPRDSRGEILMMADRHEEARASFRRALELSPGFGPSLRHLAMSWAEEGRYEEGRSELEGLIERGEATEDWLPAYGALAMLEAHGGSLRATLEVLERGRRAAADRGAGAAANGFLIWELPAIVALADWSTLDARVEELNAADPLNPFGRYLVFHAAGERGDLAEAAGMAEDMMAAVRANPAVAQFGRLLEAVTNRELAFHRGDFGGAVQWYATVRDEGGWPELGSYVAPRALLALDRPEEAERAARGAGTVDGVPTVLLDRLRHYWIGRSREARADTAGALAAYDELLDGGWAETASDVPLIADAPARRASLRGGR